MFKNDIKLFKKILLILEVTNEDDPNAIYLFQFNFIAFLSCSMHNDIDAAAQDKDVSNSRFSYMSRTKQIKFIIRYDYLRYI